MKTKRILNLFLLSMFTLALTVTSCSSDDSGSEQASQALTSIVLTSNLSGGLVGQDFTFTVKGNNGANVTADAVLTANGTVISNPHSFTATGTYEVKATYSDKTSNALNIVIDQESAITLTFSVDAASTNEDVYFNVFNNLGNNVTDGATYTLNGVEITNPYRFSQVGDNEVVATYNTFTDAKTINIVRGFSKKILLEDFTGTWCQFCPGAAAAIANVRGNNDNIMAVGYHVGVPSYPDPMEIPESRYFAQIFGINAYPTVLYGGTAVTSWNYPSSSQLSVLLAERATAGISLDTEVVGGQLNIEVGVAFAEIPTEELKLMVYILEDDVVTPSSPQSGSSQGGSYVHKDVLRDVYSDRLGDVIPSVSMSLTNDYIVNYTGLTLPSNISDMSKVKVLVFLRNTVGANRYEIYNVQEVALGESVAFD